MHQCPRCGVIGTSAAGLCHACSGGVIDARKLAVVMQIPEDRVSQVGLSLRRAANEFHGAVAREPDASQANAWRESARWFDEQADRILKMQTGIVEIK